ILLHPWPSSRTTDYQLIAEVFRFENESDGAARLVVRWSVKGRDGEIVLTERRSNYRVPATRQDQEGLVVALNEALGSFCREIAEEMKPVLGKPSSSKL
ncbi:MAG: PqiC family protein, partial [Proteobacteria bacterium]|nr:PqiC family protein [Pseudomonadota bacterium]